MWGFWVEPHLPEGLLRKQLRKQNTRIEVARKDWEKGYQMDARVGFFLEAAPRRDGYM